MPKTAIITGATRGIGKATAARLASEGYSLVLIARRQQLLEEFDKELCGKFPTLKIVSIVADVRQREQVAAVEERLQTIPEFESIRVLVNNAGLALGVDGILDGQIENWETMIDTNVKGLLYVTKTFLPRLRKYGKGATIVNMGSVAGRWPYTGGNVYGGTKAFVRQLSLNMRQDLAGTGVRVTDIEPGIVETDFSLVRFDQDAERAKAVYTNKAPLTADDIANTISFVVNLPDNTCIPMLEIVPTSQTLGPFTFSV